MSRSFALKSSKQLVHLLEAPAKGALFRKGYAIFAVLALFATTLLWAILGARLQGHNADQLSDPYMFANGATFHGASFPSSHSLLLKWPIFWLLSAIGITKLGLLVVTVATVLATVISLAYVLYRIDRRPLVFGTICLGLSLALLLVPAAPYAGALLPDNMAMLTSRNIEYILYIAAIVCFARSKHMKNWIFALGVALLAILIASDKLFLALSLGGSLAALITYSAFKAWKYVTFSLHWLLGSFASGVIAVLILASVSAIHLTHLVGGGPSPYGLAHGSHSLTLGIVYGMLDLLTNVGANPAYGNLIFRQIPHDVLHGLFGVYGIVYLAAAIVFVYTLLLTWRLVWRMPRQKPRATPTVANMLSVALIWSTVVAGGVFVATNHYYPVDARYLTISLFALVVVAATELRKRRWQQPERLLLVGCFCALAIAVATGASLHVFRNQLTALSSMNKRTNVIADALKNHKVDALVGSYWRVLPVKLAMHGSITAMPLMNCTQPEQVLTSDTWQPNLKSHSFAYLLTLNGDVAGFPKCSFHTVVAEYGRPNAMQVVSGSLSKPDEMLLFYDDGSRPPVPTKESAAPATVLPVTLGDLNYTDDCSNPTIMNFVAHEDDDLLFMNPDLQREIKAGDCVRTVFLTAGNDGLGRLYWLSRQLGSEAAYDTMLGGKQVWAQQTVELAKSEYVTVASPRGNPNVTLIFFNLPDGNLQGQGFPVSQFESLAKLQVGAIPSVQTVDKQSTYTSEQLVAALAQLMQLYRPSEIHTQADVLSNQYPDHSDHIATGKFTRAAAARYDLKEFGGEVSTPLKRYVGYPIHGYASNITDGDVQRKEVVFLAYAHYDGDVCHSVGDCDSTSTYGSYLTREYVEDQNQP